MVLREYVGQKIYKKTGGKPGAMRRAILRLNNLFTGDIYARKMLFDFHYCEAVKFHGEKNHYAAARHANGALKYSEEGYLYSENGWSHAPANIGSLDPEHANKERKLNAIIEKAEWCGAVRI